jgi:iron complex transport system ATP-binding protein
MTAVLEAISVTVHAGDRALLDNVSVALRSGETVALIGPNGAGKTTLLRVLCGELRPAMATVQLKGCALASYNPRTLAEHRFVLSQHVSVAFPFTVTDVVRMGANDRGGARIDALVESALAETDLVPFAERNIMTLSGGEQQRAHLARVLVQLACGETAHGPGVLMLDEPTASLDLRHQLDVLELAKKRARSGTAVIAILHDLNLASLFADRIVLLHRGKVAGEGTPAETITDSTLAQVFGLDTVVGRLPPPGTPFVLPHVMTSRSHFMRMG